MDGLPEHLNPRLPHVTAAEFAPTARVELGVGEVDHALAVGWHPTLEIHQHQLAPGLDEGEVGESCCQFSTSRVAVGQVVGQLDEVPLQVRLHVDPVLQLPRRRHDLEVGDWDVLDLDVRLVGVKGRVEQCHQEAGGLLADDVLKVLTRTSLLPISLAHIPVLENMRHV